MLPRRHKHFTSKYTASNKLMTPAMDAAEDENRAGNVAHRALPVRRKRRKRPLPENDGAPAAPFLSKEADETFAFLSRSRVDVEGQKPQFRSLPVLLEERRTGIWSRRGRVRRQNCSSSSSSSLWSPRQWQFEALKSFTAKPTATSIARRQWRPLAKRNIPFTHLGTPPSDAVLALERNASYIVSLGPQDEMCTTSQGLALRFYALPSPAELHKAHATISHYETSSQQRRRQYHHLHHLGTNDLNTSVPTAPLLQSTPLLHGIGSLENQPDGEESESAEETIFNFRRAISPANTPVELLVSHDWKLGVCRLRPSSLSEWTLVPRRGTGNGDHRPTANDDEPELGPVGSVVLFTMPHRRIPVSSSSSSQSTPKAITRVYRCNNVQVVSNAGLSTRNLLWNVRAIPNTRQVDARADEVENDTAKDGDGGENNNKNNSDRLWCPSCYHAHGYLFFNDEADGFRLTWTTEECILDHANVVAVSAKESPLNNGIQEYVPGIISRQSTWEVTWTDLGSGDQIYETSKTAPDRECDLAIVSEAFLHIDLLLAEILRNRKGMSGLHQPEFCYNLVSLQNEGRVADLVVAFIRPRKGYSLGIFVRVDLFSGLYEELSWVQGQQIRDAASLHFWCNKLAMNRRMKQVMAGPYSVGISHTMDWAQLCRETGNLDADRDDDFDPDCWSDYAKETANRRSKLRPPKVVSLASLYPCCDQITNKALITCQPVSSLHTKNSPIALVYG